MRRGPNYKEKRKKAPSAPALYEVFAVDVHASERKLAHIGRVVELPTDPSPPPRDAGLPPYVIINWMVPDYAPSGLLQAKRSDGPGWNLVLYCRLSDAIREQLARRAATGGSGSSSSGGGGGGSQSRRKGIGRRWHIWEREVDGEQAAAGVASVRYPVCGKRRERRGEERRGERESD